MVSHLRARRDGIEYSNAISVAMQRITSTELPPRGQLMYETKVDSNTKKKHRLRVY